MTPRASRWSLLALVLSACGAVPSEAPAPACAFPSAPAVVREADSGVLLLWSLDDGPGWHRPALPDEAAYRAYRAHVTAAGADAMRPAQVVPAAQRGREMWRRELHNVERAYSGEAGTLRPVTCLEALLFAYQTARHPQAERPTEFLASVLRKEAGGTQRLRVYLGASGALFPPKAVYGFDVVARDVADGWDYLAMLHNHTLQDADGALRLGVPAPSASDVHLLRGLAEDLGLARALVTNGFYTVDIPSGALGQYLGPE